MVAELGKKLDKRVRDVEKLSDLAKVRQLVQGCGGRPRRIGGHSCWQLRHVLRASDSVHRQSCCPSRSFEVVHTVQTVQLVCLVAVVDVPAIMHLVFQQSKSNVFCAAFPRQSVGHSSCATEGDSTLQFLNKVVYAVVHDKCQWSRRC